MSGKTTILHSCDIHWSCLYEFNGKDVYTKSARESGFGLVQSINRTQAWRVLHGSVKDLLMGSFLGCPVIGLTTGLVLDAPSPQCFEVLCYTRMRKISVWYNLCLIA